MFGQMKNAKRITAVADELQTSLTKLINSARGVIEADAELQRLAEQASERRKEAATKSGAPPEGAAPCPTP